MKDIFIRLSLTWNKDLLVENTFYNRFSGIVIEPHIYMLYRKSYSTFIENIRNKKKLLFDMGFFRFSPSVYDSYSNKIWYFEFAEKFNIPVSETKPYLDPRDIKNTRIKKIIDRALDFQTTEVKEDVKNVINKKRSLLSWLSSENEEEEIIDGPDILMAPYLVIEEVLVEDDFIDKKDFLDLNIAFIKVMKEKMKERNIDKPLMAVLALSEDVLDPVFLSDVIDAYIKEKPDILGIWISGLNEHTHLPSLRTFLEKILIPIKQKASDINIFNMYAGFFSYILYHLDKPNLLDGVIFGIGYGEHKIHDFAPTGFKLQYYYNKTHKLEPRSVINFLYDLGLVDCQCPVCRTIKSLDDFSNLQNKPKLLATHFLYNRLITEMNDLQKLNTIDDFVSFLKSEKEDLNEISNKVKENVMVYDRLVSTVSTLEKWSLYLNNIKHSDEMNIIK